MTHHSRILRRAAISLAALLAASAAFAVPPYMAKPPTWTSTLVTNDEKNVTDKEFAQWVKAAQQTRVNSFSFIATFTQCFGGGFLEELGQVGVTTFGANSASRYFEPAWYNRAGQNIYYSFAWQWYANANANDTDSEITDDAHDALILGNNMAIPPLPPTLRQNAQYKTDSMNVPPMEKLRAADRNYAILFAGEPNPLGWDYNAMCDLYTVLTNKGYGAGDIHVLYGNNVDPNPMDNCVLDAAATRQNLEDAFDTWLPNEFNMLDEEETVQVFFWAGDHGNAEFPVAISVDEPSTGMPMKGAVNARKVAMQPVGSVVYEAGSGLTATAWRDPMNRDIDGISFGDDFQPGIFAKVPNPKPYPDPYPYPHPVDDGAIVYFSVDRGSRGLPGTDVSAELAGNRSPAPDVFVATGDQGNRQVFDGERSFGLVDPIPPPMPLVVTDETDALVMRNILDIANPMQNLLSRPLFYSVRNSAAILAYDPMRAVMNLYTYYQIPAAMELDALALLDDGMLDMNQKLYFDSKVDILLFSVGRAENMAPWNGFKPCDILRIYWDPALMRDVVSVWRSCQDLGLDPGIDNVDALDLGAGAEGEPIEYPEEYPYEPRYYPPYPGPSPTPDPKPVPTP